MSKFSNLVTAGIFIIFLAVLFHYFCRVRKKPDMVIQQQVQVGEGYVYPITPNSQQLMGPNYPVLDQRFTAPSNVPYPINFPLNAGVQYPYPYPPGGGPVPQSNVTRGFPTVHQHQNPPQHHPEDDLPPPYHTVVASTPYPH